MTDPFSRRAARRILALTATCLLLLAAPLRAELAAPDGPQDTLQLMADHLKSADPALGLTLTPTLDATDLSLSVTLPDGSVVAIYPDNLDLALRAEPDGNRRQEIFDSHMGNVLLALQEAVSGGLDAPVDPATILPVIRAASGVHQSAMEDAPSAPFPGDLMQYWVIDRPDTTASLGRGDMAGLGLDEAGLTSLALSNLEGRLTQMSTSREAGFNVISLDDYYESSLMLLPALWQERAAGAQNLIAAIPTRSTLLWIADPSAEELARLRDLVSGLHSSVPWSISADLFRWTGEGWVVLPE